MVKLEKINRGEAFRYMGQRGELTAELRGLADECEARLLSAISPKLVYAAVSYTHLTLPTTTRV